MDSAAFDLVPVTNEKAGAEIRDTPISQLKAKRRAKRKNPTGKKILRDEWLAPLSLAPGSMASDPQVSKTGVRASDKGFLDVSLGDYLGLLRWTAKQNDEKKEHRVPPRLQAVVSRLGIDLTMWRDLVWNFKRYFGGSCCAGSPEGMSGYAKSTGRNYSRGQRAIAACFVATS